MRSIVVFFALALLFTFGYCTRSFTAVGVLYCPSKTKWSYTVQLFEGVKNDKGRKLGDAHGYDDDSQLRFYEIKAETGLAGYPDLHFGIEMYHTCGGSKASWGGYTMFVPVEGGKSYGFTAHDLGKEM